MTMMTIVSYAVPVPPNRTIGTGAANPKAFGAMGNGTTDDTAAFNRAIASMPQGGTLTVDEGSYLLDPVVGVSLVSKLWIKNHKKVRYIAKKNAEPRTGMFKVNGVNNVLVSGGTAYGDRYTHDYSVPSDPSKKTHEWNHCFQVYGSEKITIRDFCGIGFAGDGLSMASKDVSDSSAEEPVDDVLLDNVAFIDCRRQGISIGKATNVVVQYSTCAKTNGTSPECGIDIEPESGGTTRNIHIYRCSLMDNAKNGVEILRRSGVTTPLQEVYVVECNLSENVMGAQTTSVEGVAFYSNIVRHNSATGIRINAGTTGLNITGCTFGQNYDQGGNGSSRTPFNRTGWDKSLEKDILPYNDMAQNFFGVNYYQ